MCSNVKEAVTSSLQVRDNAGTRWHFCLFGWHSSPSLDAHHNLRLLVMAFNLVVCDSNPDITEMIGGKEKLSKLDVGDSRGDGGQLESVLVTPPWETARASCFSFCCYP